MCELFILGVVELSDYFFNKVKTAKIVEHTCKNSCTSAAAVINVQAVMATRHQFENRCVKLRMIHICSMPDWPM